MTKAQDLPPLGFLPAFEAAGRLGSFKSAANELHVTPSAVSQQIKALEASLGIALFRRSGRLVQLTEEGAAYLVDVRQALGDLTIAGRRLRRRSGARVLRISTVPFWAFEIMLPRLSAFHAAFPSFELRMETSMQLVDFAVSDIDAAIRIGGGPWPGLTTRNLGVAHVTPVCSPALAKHIHKPSDLRTQTLIDIRGQEHRGWRAFLKNNRIHADSAKWLSLETYFETMRAAEQGLGVAFGVFPMTSAWLLDGRIAAPFEWRNVLPGHVSLVHRIADNDRFPFAAIAEWLTAEYNTLPPLPPGRIDHAK